MGIPACQGSAARYHPANLATLGSATYVYQAQTQLYDLFLAAESGETATEKVTNNPETESINSASFSESRYTEEKDSGVQLHSEVL